MGLVHIVALCRQCGFSQYAKNAMGLAAQRHQRTGHTVDVESGYAHTFGDRAVEEFHDRNKPVVTGSRK